MKFKTPLLIAALSLGLAACTDSQEANFYIPSTTDLRILETAKSYLTDESTWARNDETRCDLNADALTLFCALQKASFEVTNDFQLRRPALEEVRYAIDAMSETALDRRLIDFNNLDTTDLADIHKVLDTAHAGIQARLDNQG